MQSYDYIIVGSGFGGSVSALRLAEKGYRVAVLERGKRWRSEDFPKTNWNARKFLWAPKIFCYGIQAITFLRDVMILHGSGVGGGSLVYANTLLVPPERVFRDERWPKSAGDWYANLSPHYATAQKMLGVTKAQCMGTTDNHLRDIARDMGREDTFKSTDVGIYFGEAGETVPDPYFDGKGPERTGCTLCGGCMVGCRHGAKNTLDKNYLYLAEQLGVQIIAETNVEDIREDPAGGYFIDTSRTTDFLFKRKQTFKAGGVVLSGGVLGTVPLLFKCKERGSLPRLSDALGNYVRTNSESLVGAVSRRKNVDYSKGIAIASGFHPDDDTHIEMVRYGAGQDFMSLLATILVGGGPPWPRMLRFIGAIFTKPLSFLRSLNPFGWAKRTGILLVMQPLPNHMRMVFRRRWWWPFKKRLDTDSGTDAAVPSYIPIANEVAERLAEKTQGDAMSTWPEVVFDLSSTAHILGGCPLGEDAGDGVIDAKGRVFGYDNFYIADGSAVPVNLSVNPSLTITAMSEWTMSHIAPKNQGKK